MTTDILLTNKTGMFMVIILKLVFPVLRKLISALASGILQLHQGRGGSVQYIQKVQVMTKARKRRTLIGI